jgi:hypothetical protein
MVEAQTEGQQSILVPRAVHTAAVAAVAVVSSCREQRRLPAQVPGCVSEAAVRAGLGARAPGNWDQRPRGDDADLA